MGVLPEVPGRSHDHHTGVDGAFRRERQRVRPIGFADARADRQIRNANVISSAIRDDPVERLNDVADGAVSVRVEDLQRHDARVGCHTGFLPARVVAVSGDDAGDVRAVPVVVVRQRLAVHEVDERRHTLIAVWIRRRRVARQVVVPGGDARVDHRDADARARHTERPLRGKCAHRQRRAEVVLEDRAVVVDVEDVRMRRQLFQQAVWQINHVPVDQVQLAGARVFLEFGRQLGARLERDDHARRGEWVVVLRAEGELFVEFPVLHVPAGHARFGFERRVRMMSGGEGA